MMAWVCFGFWPSWEGRGQLLFVCVPCLSLSYEYWAALRERERDEEDEKGEEKEEEKATKKIENRK